MSKPYEICRRCLMDTSDPDITFTGGICNHCLEYEEKEAREVHYGDNWERSARDKIAQIKMDKPKISTVDCVIGLSGGLDSSYALLKAVEFGLKPFAIIVDNGYDTEQSSKNVWNMIHTFNIPFQKIDIDTPEYHDLQLSFLKASVINAEAPTDHIITAALFEAARDAGVKWILTGGNVVSECIMPKAWGYDAKDWLHIKAVQKRFGKYDISHFPHLTLFGWFKATIIDGIKFFPLLNWIPYNKNDAEQELQEKLNWKPYGQKHMESKYTRWFQGWLLPVKFGIDKRRAHLSTLINSGQITRREALEIMKQDYYTKKMFEDDFGLIQNKLRISGKELMKLCEAPVKHYTEYPNNAFWFELLSGLVAYARQKAIGNK